MTHDVSMEALVLMLMGGEEAVKERLAQDAEELQQMYSQLRHKEPDEAMLRLQEKVMQELAIQKGEYNG